MKTEEAIRIALDMSGFGELPGDSAIHVEGEFFRPLVAVDVGVGELMLARSLGCDGVIAHHPLGTSNINFYKVLSRHAELMRQFGLSGDLDSPIQPLVEKSKMRYHVSINGQTVDAARRLGLPLINVHLPCDEIGRRLMQERIDSSGPTVGDVISSLEQMKEFQGEVRPEVVLGSRNAKRGRTALVVAAGTNGGYAVAKKYMMGGADTVVYMHIDLEELKKLREDKELEGKNLLLIGHAPGDSVGINAYVRELKKTGVSPTPIGLLGADYGP
jgi:hypothetical protein